MTQSINKPFKANEAAEQVKQLKKSFDAPAVQAVKGLVPTPKVAKTPVKKAGRIVGISADENKYIQDLLEFVTNDPHFGKNNPMYVKIQGRYNK